MTRTIQVCLNEDDLNMLDRIKKYYDSLQHEEEDASRSSTAYYPPRVPRRRRGYYRSMRSSRTQMQERINDTYAFKKMLLYFWTEHADKIKESEKHHGRSSEYDPYGY